MEIEETINVVLVDDHKLFRAGIAGLVNDLAGYTVKWEADNGKDFIQKISKQNLPEIVLLDIEMKVMGGFETAQWIRQHYPEIKILVLTAHKEHYLIMRMIRTDVAGIILKAAAASELLIALEAVKKDGGYFPLWVTKMLLNWPGDVKLTEKEIEFLQLACTELPQKAFGSLMKMSPRNVEAMRDSLFRKLEVVSRVGLVLYAIKNGIFTFEEGNDN